MFTGVYHVFAGDDVVTVVFNVKGNAGLSLSRRIGMLPVHGTGSGHSCVIETYPKHENLALGFVDGGYPR